MHHPFEIVLPSLLAFVNVGMTLALLVLGIRWLFRRKSGNQARQDPGGAGRAENEFC
jgi:hypothetical protein